MTKRFTLGLIALVALAMLILPASAAAPIATIAPGGDVFIGEQNLDVSAAVTAPTTLEWYASGSSPGTDAPNAQITVTVADAANFYVAPSTFVGRTGNWYNAGTYTAPAIVVYDPTIEVKIWDINAGKDVTGKQVNAGDILDFRIETNTYSVYQRFAANPANAVGWVTIKVKTADGATYNALYQTTTASRPLTNQVVTSSLWYWSAVPPTSQPPVAARGWNTLVTDTAGNRIYKAGTYTVTAELALNSIKDNYKAPDGSDYTGKTVTSLKTVNLAGDTVKIEVSKDTVVRGNQFSATVTGRANEFYYVWVKGTSSMTDPQKQPPLILFNQDSVTQDPIGGPYTVGSYLIEGGNCQKTLYEDVSHAVNNGVQFYCKIKTSSSGTRTVGFETNANTDDKKYTLRVENNFGTCPNNPNYKSDEYDVKVEKGAVTVVAAGDQSYFLGQEVLLSGTNSESDFVYLFITGPNLPVNGGLMTDPRVAILEPNSDPAKNMVPPVSTDVNEDNTWEYKWQTAGLNIDAGTYTIYATADEVNKGGLSDTQYGTVSVIIRKPFVTAQASQSTVAQGDSVHFRGIAEGQPSQGVAIWIMGKNYATAETESVNDDGTFDYEVDGAKTSGMTSGQYFVVIQHPMYNDEFDVIVQGDYVVGTYPIQWSQLFKLYGSGSLQGSDAANALTVALDNAAIDDTYTKLQFLVEVPEIKIVPITEKMVGDKFEVKGTTNLAVDDELLVEIYSSSFGPTPKETSGEFSGVSGTVKVVKGTEGFNTWSMPVDTTTFKPDEYIVQVSAIGLNTAQDVTATTLFNVVEFVPTTVPTTPPPTTAATTVPTTPPTPVPTTTPGFGALVALIGLGAVAFLIVRKH